MGVLNELGLGKGVLSARWLSDSRHRAGLSQVYGTAIYSFIHGVQGLVPWRCWHRKSD